MIRVHTLIVAAGIALACTLPLSSAQAGGLKPGFQAHMQLKNGSGWALYDAGCLAWNYQQHSWYSRCGLPQNAILHPHPIVAKY